MKFEGDMKLEKMRKVIKPRNHCVGFTRKHAGIVPKLDHVSSSHDHSELARKVGKEVQKIKQKMEAGSGSLLFSMAIKNHHQMSIAR